MIRRSLTILVLVLFGAAVLCSCACAENGAITVTEWKDQLLEAQRFTFAQHKDGIGYGDVPVYTAPSEKALRFANNRQACDTNKELYEAGYCEEGWLLVRYDPGNGRIRVGYIAPQYIKGFKSKMGKRTFDYIPVVAGGPIQVWDNPLKSGTPFAEFSAGESFAVLGKYTYHGNWWYIECTAEGKTARGFIDREISALSPGSNVADSTDQAPVTLQTLGTPSKSPLGTEQIGTVTVNGNKGDERKQVHQDADPQSKQVTVAYPTQQYPCYAEKTGTDGKTFYYIFVEEDSTWGWLHSGYATLGN